MLLPWSRRSLFLLLLLAASLLPLAGARAEPVPWYNRLDQTLAIISTDLLGAIVVDHAKKTGVVIRYDDEGQLDAAGEYNPATRTITLTGASRWADVWNDSDYERLVWHELWHVVQRDRCPNVSDPWMHYNSARMDVYMDGVLGWHDFQWLDSPLFSLLYYQRRVHDTHLAWDWGRCILVPAKIPEALNPVYLFS